MNVPRRPQVTRHDPLMGLDHGCCVLYLLPDVIVELEGRFRQLKHMLPILASQRDRAFATIFYRPSRYSTVKLKIDTLLIN
jgi:hypothetical protein